VKIAVIGTGYVGLVLGACLAKLGNKVFCIDIDKEKIAKLNQGKSPIYEPQVEEIIKKAQKRKKISFHTEFKKPLQESEAIFIAVGTPQRKDGKADLTYVEAAAEEIGKNMNNYKLVIVKSTVPVGTGQKVKKIICQHYNGDFDIASNPEFLREGHAVQDFLKPDRIVIGTETARARDIMLKIYEPLDFPKVTTTVESSEMIKYASNAFLATKISFINEIANICEKVGADVEDVARGMGLDSRIGSSFLKAGIGWGGSCFPKDVHALNQIAGTSGYDFRLLKAVIEVNAKQRAFVLDKLEELFGNLKGKKICVLGLSFKANTDDVRESVAIEIIRTLVGLGAKVATYDPKAIVSAINVLSDGIVFSKDAYKAAKNSDALVIATEWPEFEKLDYKKIKKLLRQPIIIDGRNLLNPQKMRKLGFRYFGVGRGLSK
jgi:UDPglucose 6-dehydrogenase